MRGTSAAVKKILSRGLESRRHNARENWNVFQKTWINRIYDFLPGQNKPIAYNVEVCRNNRVEKLFYFWTRSRIQQYTVWKVHHRPVAVQTPFTTHF